MNNQEQRFDVDAYKRKQLELWNASARAWDVWHDRIESWFAPITARLLELGEVKRGQRVLDLGTGYGEPGLTAARVVGPGGSVLGIDLAPAMLEVARRRAHGQSNIRFAELDIEALHSTEQFDVALSRLGLMFAVDRPSTLQAIRQALQPGGILAAAVWGAPSSHGISQALGPLMARLGLPPPPAGSPTPFSMSDPKQFTDELNAAGFRDVLVTEVTVPCRFDSVDEFVRFNLEALPPEIIEAIRDKFGSEDAPEAWSTVAQKVHAQTGPDGALVLPCLTLCARGARPTLLE